MDLDLDTIFYKWIMDFGFTLIFGAMEKLNMAYAASSIGGAYVGLGVSVLLSLPLYAIFLIGPIGGGLLSVFVYICCFMLVFIWFSWV